MKGNVNLSSVATVRHCKQSGQATARESSVLRVPLVVDLHGLVKTNLLIESITALLRDRPSSALAMPFWLFRGKRSFQREIARRTKLDAGFVPYRWGLVECLKRHRAMGRRLLLIADSDPGFAHAIADYLDIFDSVLSTDDASSSVDERKRQCLVSRFGERGFDYAGDCMDGLAVWFSARQAIIVNSDRQAVRAVSSLTQLRSILEDRANRLPEYLNALRPQHWLKNLLVFAPLLAAHRFNELSLWTKTTIIFLAFCCCASSGYLVNDLFDLRLDRRHPRKRFRPFAEGRLPLCYALVMIPILFLAGCVLGSVVNRSAIGFLLLYYGLTLAYSTFLKRITLLDVILLTGLYGLRLGAGAIPVRVWLSGWLLAFSTFLFFSLALAKRYVELAVTRGGDGNLAARRMYEATDSELLVSAGIASGYVSVLVLALYLASNTAQVLYRRSELMWFLCPLLLYWISHFWLVAHRRKMPDDPLAFAVSDRTSQILIVFMVLTVSLSV